MNRKQWPAIKVLIAISLSALYLFCTKQENRSLKSNNSQQRVTTSNDSMAGQSTQALSEKSVTLIKSLDDLNSIVEGTPGRLLIFDLYADWCRPCRILAPTFAALANDHSHKADFFRIDVQKNPDIASAFNVRGIPYVVFIKDKQIVHSLRGLNAREQYERVITTCDSTVSAEDCRTKMQQVL